MAIDHDTVDPVRRLIDKHKDDLGGLRDLEHSMDGVAVVTKANDGDSSLTPRLTGKENFI